MASLLGTEGTGERLDSCRWNRKKKTIGERKGRVEQIKAQIRAKMGIAADAAAAAAAEAGDDSE